MLLRFTCGLAARLTNHSSPSPGLFAEQTRLSAEAPRKYPRVTLRKAQRPEKSSQTEISNLAVSSFSSFSQVTLQTGRRQGTCACGNEGRCCRHLHKARTWRC